MAKRKPKVQPKTVNLAQIKALYDAATNGRRMRGWSAPSSGPNVAVQGLQTIRNRSRDTSRNDWSGESAVTKWTTNLIGIGIRPRFKRITSKERKQALMDLWDDFVSHSDADGVLNYYGQQTLGVRSWFESGEVFIRRRYRRLNGGFPVPLQIQLIEADYVPMLDADSWPGMPAGNRMRSGIELDKFGSRAAYWLYRSHPGDRPNALTLGDANLLIRVPAEEIRHMFEPKRPGQLRGVPGMAPVLARLRNINDYDDAVLERQKLANLFVAFITRTMPGADSEFDIDPLTNMPIEWSGGEPLAGMQPGLTQELDPGQDVKFANPPEAGTTYSDYMRTQNMGTAAAAGLPYEVFSGDIANVSDRTLRVIIQEFRRLAEQRQWQIIIPMFCQPVVEWFADAAMMAGKITAEEVDLVRRVEHAPHGWQYIHPVQDPQGKQLEVDAGFRSRSSVIAERGDDPEAVDDERAADKKRADDLGLTPPPPTAAGGDPKAAPQKDQKQQPSQLERAMTGLIQTQIAAAMKTPEPVQPTVNNIVVHTPTVTTNVEAPAPQNITNNVIVPEQAAPIVNVAPADVKVDVAPAAVTIENNVAPSAIAELSIAAMPTRVTTSAVEYDSAGNITKTTQTESDSQE